MNPNNPNDSPNTKQGYNPLDHFLLQKKDAMVIYLIGIGANIPLNYNLEHLCRQNLLNQDSFIVNPNSNLPIHFNPNPNPFTHETLHSSNPNLSNPHPSSNPSKYLVISLNPNLLVYIPSNPSIAKVHH